MASFNGMENFSGVKVKEEEDTGPARWSEESWRMEQAKSRRMASEAGIAAACRCDVKVPRGAERKPCSLLCASRTMHQNAFC